MKKSTLSRLLSAARSNPSLIDSGAKELIPELSGHAVDFEPDNGADATKEDIQQACISLVKALEMHGQPPSSRVVEMLEWAIELRRRRPGQPRKLGKREEAIFEEAAFQYPLSPSPLVPPISGRELAKRMGVAQATVRKWRKDPNYLRDIEGIIEEDIEDSME